jgi:hypothetical protein
VLFCITRPRLPRPSTAKILDCFPPAKYICPLSSKTAVGEGGEKPMKNLLLYIAVAQLIVELLELKKKM